MRKSLNGRIMDVNVLETGSTGNCVILNDIIALDMGVTYKKVAPYVKKLQLVWVGHAHHDHLNNKTIRRLASERPMLRFACGPFLVNDFLQAGVMKRNIDVLEAVKRYDYGAFQLEPFELFHDCPNYGLKIYMGGEKILYAVDTGYIDHIEAKDFSLFLIEANHHEEEIKERIAEKQSRGEFSYESRAAKTHLSYEQAMNFIAKNAVPNSKYVLLHGHKERSKSHGMQA